MIRAEKRSSKKPTRACDCSDPSSVCHGGGVFIMMSDANWLCGLSIRPETVCLQSGRFPLERIDNEHAGTKLGRQRRKGLGQDQTVAREKRTNKLAWD